MSYFSNSKTECNCGCPMNRRETYNARNANTPASFGRQSNHRGHLNFYRPLTFRDDECREPYDDAGSSGGDSDYGTDEKTNKKKWYIPESTPDLPQTKKEVVPASKVEVPSNRRVEKKATKKRRRPKILRGANKKAKKVGKGKKRRSKSKKRPK